MSNEMLICPYNKNHEVYYKRFQKHLLKCEQQYGHLKLVRCIFNATHMVPLEERAQHALECEDAIKCNVQTLKTLAECRKKHTDQFLQEEANKKINEWMRKSNDPRRFQDFSMTPKLPRSFNNGSAGDGTEEMRLMLAGSSLTPNLGCKARSAFNREDVAQALLLPEPSDSAILADRNHKSARGMSEPMESTWKMSSTHQELSSNASAKRVQLPKRSASYFNEKKENGWW